MNSGLFFKAFLSVDDDEIGGMADACRVRGRGWRWDPLLLTQRCARNSRFYYEAILLQMATNESKVRGVLKHVTNLGKSQCTRHY